jgi:hypothetical protein
MCCEEETFRYRLSTNFNVIHIRALINISHNKTKNALILKLCFYTQFVITPICLDLYG